MKVDFGLPGDDKIRRICLKCHAEGVRRIKAPDKILYQCTACGRLDVRSLYWGNRKYWVSPTGEVWQELSTVFVRNAEGKFLFFEHIEFPHGITTPTGHVDIGQTAHEAASSELEEEAGIKGQNLNIIGSIDMAEDPCSGGVDAHRWQIYMEVVKSNIKVNVSDDEGRFHEWLTLDEARARPLLLSVRRIIDEYQDELESQSPELKIKTKLPVKPTHLLNQI